VLHSQTTQFTMEHNNALDIDSEYSLWLLQNDTGKARSSQQQRITLPLDNHIQMLGKPSREKGELEGVASTSPNVKPQATNPT
ncbi:hypothetical protein LL295_13005, partial [Vibrio campbellii]|nr:hypothetical protein [Vibrio campbellii]